MSITWDDVLEAADLADSLTRQYGAKIRQELITPVNKDLSALALPLAVTVTVIDPARWSELLKQSVETVYLMGWHDRERVLEKSAKIV